MAKTTGPLMSLDASGTVAKTLVFSKWKGRNYVRQWVIPSNPQSLGQTIVRANFAGLVALYQANVALIQTNFGVRAAQLNISAFNAFMGFNQTRISGGGYAANNVTPTDAAPLNNVTALVATPGIKQASVVWEDAADTNAWGVAIYRKVGSAPTGTASELVALVRRGVQSFLDTPLVTGTYFYGAKAVSINGGATGLGPTDDAIVA